MKIKLLIFSMVVLSLSFGTALGDITNTRPVTAASGLTELQTEFNNIGSNLNANTDQSPYAYFSVASSGTAAATYIATISYTVGDIEFGIYELGDTTNKVKVFDSDTMSLFSGLSVSIEFYPTAPAGPLVIASGGLVGIVDSSTDYFSDFGFYAISDYGTFYSEDALNPGGFTRMLTYAGLGDDVTIGGVTGTDADHWYVASEVFAIGDVYTYDPLLDATNGDYSDFIVQMESITPIPVPAAVLLGLLGLGAAGIKMRKFA